MSATACPRTVAEENFGAALLGNRSRTQRLVQLAERLLRHPEGTLPQKLQRPADLRALYRLVNCDAVTHQSILQPHYDRTRQLMAAAQGTVLILHDTTEIDLTGLTALHPHLGQIGNGLRRGYLCHNSLAVQAETRNVLGLANQILFCRPRVPKDETRDRKRRRKRRESRLWKKGSQAIGPAPAGRRWVDVGDRGADLFEFLDFKHRQRGLYVVRAQHDRTISVLLEGQPVRARLFATAGGLPALGGQYVEVPARDGQPARTARVTIRAGAVQLQPPQQKRGEHGNRPLAVWVVQVREESPPAGVEALHWVLLTNVAVESLAAACEVIGWYECRWIIEELHKGQKTGCGLERMQFTTPGAMQPALGLISGVAVFLLQLRCLSRQADAGVRPATAVVPEPYVAVLSGWRYGEQRPAMTVREFFYALARLGGHQNRKGDGQPGWQVLWHGWMELQAMVQGAEIVGFPKHGQT